MISSFPMKHPAIGTSSTSNSSNSSTSQPSPIQLSPAHDPRAPAQYHSPFQNNAHAEPRVANDQLRSSKTSFSSSLALPLTAFLVVASILILHLYLDDPSFFLLFFDHHGSESTPVATPDLSFRDSWTTETIKPPPLDYQLVPASNPSSNCSSTWTFLLLHGLGDHHASDSYRLREGLLQLRPDLFDSVRFIIPSAGELAITVFGGQRRSAWFDIKNWTNVHQQEDVQHMKQNVYALRRILRHHHLQLNRTIIGGFSQGAVMSLLLSLTLENLPAGLIMLSGYPPIPEKLQQLVPSSFFEHQGWKTSLHWLHGELDPYFKIKFARDGFDSLKKSLQASPTSSAKDSSSLSLRFNSVPNLGHNWSTVELQILIQTIEDILVSP